MIDAPRTSPHSIATSRSSCLACGAHPSELPCTIAPSLCRTRHGATSPLAASMRSADGEHVRRLFAEVCRAQQRVSPSSATASTAAAFSYMSTASTAAAFSYMCDWHHTAASCIARGCSHKHHTLRDVLAHISPDVLDAIQVPGAGVGRGSNARSPPKCASALQCDPTAPLAIQPPRLRSNRPA